MKKSNLTDYPNYRVSKRGKIIRLSDGKVIKCYLNHRFNRYYCWLYDSKNIRVKVYRYRLVAMAWIPNPENKPEVCHIDNNSTHDYYKNLYWGTHKENSQQMVLEGRSLKGIPRKTKLDSEFIRKEWETGNYMSLRELGRKYSVSHTTIKRYLS